LSPEGELLGGLLPIVGLICVTFVVVEALNAGINGMLINGYIAFVSSVISGSIMYKVGKKKGE